MPNFWSVEDAQQKQSNLSNFGKNMALSGAALTLLACSYAEVQEPLRHHMK
jgi:hypothetical protein